MHVIQCHAASSPHELSVRPFLRSIDRLWHSVLCAQRSACQPPLEGYASPFTSHFRSIVHEGLFMKAISLTLNLSVKMSKSHTGSIHGPARRKHHEES